MKQFLFTSIVGLLFFATSGCRSVNYSGEDEARIVARVLANSMGAPLSFSSSTDVERLLSSLNTSDYFAFATVLDAQGKLFASYFQTDQNSHKEEILARVSRSLPGEKSETLIQDGAFVIAIVPVDIGHETIGYVAVGRRGRKG